MSGRPDPYVLARFLDSLVAEPRRSKSSLQRACRVNYDVFRRYFDFCLRQGYVTVRETPEGDEVGLTDSGREAHRRLVGWIRDLFGNVRL